jgi:hypothetical protein
MRPATELVVRVAYGGCASQIVVAIESYFFQLYAGHLG